ncbi:MAG: 4Fe-4S dicluster domain-containing protein, partial [Candidatus Thorarchaeota archaeon]
MFELVALPPSVPGFRLQRAMDRAFKNAGGTLLIGHQARSAVFKNDMIESVVAQSPRREVTISPKTVVLASGKFIGGGLEADENGIRETVLDLMPVTTNLHPAEEVRPVYHTNVFSLSPDGHAVLGAGLAVDMDFRPIDADGVERAKNLFCAGSILAKYNYSLEKSGLGVALSTGLAAGRRITPYHRNEIEIVHSVEACINCGLCINHCPVVAAVGVDRFTGPRSIAVELSRSPPEFWSTADKIYLCTGCGTCREVCPKNVNVPEVVNLVRARIFEHRPDLVPKGLHMVREIIVEHNLAFEPWDDPEEKVESRDVRLERLGIPHTEDIIKKNAEVLFYPGCQAEERAQEVREAAKVVLNYFDVDYTLLDDMSCCGLPSALMGD